MSAWVKHGFTGADDLTKLFQRCYGLEKMSGGAADSQNWQNAIADFQQTFTQFAAQWGWVTQDEHDKTLDKVAELEEKVKEQEATISRLRDLLNQEGIGHSELFQHFKGALENQTEQFQDLMKSITNAGKNKD